MVYKGHRDAQSVSSDCDWKVTLVPPTKQFANSLNMKAFIVALLVACVAAQDLDLLKLKEKSLLKFNRPVYDELMLKHKLGYPVERSLIYGDNVEVPTLFDEDTKVWGLEEIVQTTLFREYMTLPLFRQYWNYPMFQRYVASIYFQRFWQIPTFKQYFVQPTLFYKYVYPLVTVFKYDTTTTYPTTYGYDELINGQDYTTTWNKNVFPFVYGQRDLLNKKHFVPTTYTQEYKPVSTHHLFYKNLLDKIYSDVYTFDKPELIEDKTIFPVETLKTTPFETTYGDKFVKEMLLKKMLEKKMMLPEIYGEETTFKTHLPEEMLLKKMLEKKMIPEIYGEETYKTVIPEEMYTTKYTMPTYKFNPLVRMMYGMKKPVYNFETEKMMLNKEDVLPLFLEKELLTNKIHLNKLFEKEIEIPKTFETTKFEHIPLTETKPMMGVKTFDKFEKIIPEIKV